MRSRDAAAAVPLPRASPLRKGAVVTGRTYRLGAVLLTAAAVALSGCTAGSDTAQRKGGGGGQSSLSIGFVVEPVNLDFTKTSPAATPQALLVNVYEGLVKLNENGNIQPLLARSWTVSPDRKVYDFKLQDGATFTNGAKFTADDVKFSIERVQSPEWTSSLKQYMAVVDTVEVVSLTEVRVYLKQPSNNWLFEMTTRIGAIFSKTGVSDLANTAIGTGPYRVQKWNRGDSIVLVQNDKYWGRKPAMKTVTLKYFKDATALNNALLTGGINVISTLQTPDTLRQFSRDKRYQVIEGTTNGEVVLSFNNGRSPLKDKRVRQAICYAVDRKAVVDTAWGGHGQLIGSMVPPTDPWYEDLSDLYPYDPAKARALLAASGHRKLDLAFRIPNLPYAVSVAQVVKSQLAQVGVNAKIDVLEFPTRWLDQVFTKYNYDMSVINHVEPRDIQTFGNSTYYWRYDNPQVQHLLATADEGTEQEQVADYKQVARTLAEDAAADWLFLFPNIMVADKGIGGLPKNAVTEQFDLTTLSRS